MKKLAALLLLFALALPAAGQVKTVTGHQYGPDASRPGSCSPGAIWINSDDTQNTFACVLGSWKKLLTVAPVDGSTPTQVGGFMVDDLARFPYFIDGGPLGGGTITVTASQTGGSLPAGTYHYAVSGVGENNWPGYVGPDRTCTISTSTGKCTIVLTSFDGFWGWIIWRGTTTAGSYTRKMDLTSVYPGANIVSRTFVDDDLVGPAIGYGGIGYGTWQNASPDSSNAWRSRAWSMSGAGLLTGSQIKFSIFQVRGGGYFQASASGLNPPDTAYLDFELGTAWFRSTVTAPTFIGSLSGNATTATSLAANGANCSSGQAPLGVSASGAAEGCFTVVTPGGAATLTNKRWTPRVGSITTSATPTVDSDAYDVFEVTALTDDVTGVTVTGTPTEWQTLVLVFTAAGSQTLTLGSQFEAGSIPLPTAISGTRIDLGFVYNSATGKWRLLADS